MPGKLNGGKRKRVKQRPKKSERSPRVNRRLVATEVASQGIKATSDTQPPDYKHFWPSLLRAAESEPRDIKEITGASGIRHQVIAAGFDDRRKRLLVVSAEQDARSAALAQADIGAVMPGFKVVLARPIVVDLPGLAQQITNMAGRSVFGARDVPTGAASDQKAMQRAMEPYLQAIGPTLTQWVSNIQGVGSVGLLTSLAQIVQQLSANPAWFQREGMEVRLDELSKLEPMQQDQALGTCPLPLYSFSGEEMETIHKGTDLDAIKHVFSEHGVLQYFFPPADQLALGLVDRSVLTGPELVERLKSAPVLGHPYGKYELLSSDVGVVELIDALAERKYIAKGELTYEITPEGQSVRRVVSVMPREALVSKLINRIRVKIDLKSFFRIG
jgi:hypothetical protein